MKLVVWLKQTQSQGTLLFCTLTIDQALFVISTGCTYVHKWTIIIMEVILNVVKSWTSSMQPMLYIQFIRGSVRRSLHALNYMCMGWLFIILIIYCVYMMICTHSTCIVIHILSADNITTYIVKSSRQGAAAIDHGTSYVANHLATMLSLTIQCSCVLLCKEEL